MLRTIEYFNEISRYPRPSKHEEKIRDFLISWGKGRGFSVQTDTIGNIVISVPSRGSSSKNPVILQSHIDMVCVKTPESQHDFSRDPIEIYEENGFLRARGTSLGADNGIGVALSMAACDFDSHPPLELVFTVDEEAGMSGVENLDFSLLSAKKVINLDSEDEDEICISSAGGIGITAYSKIERSERSNIPKYTISFSGMRGGHSGCEIHENRGNAITALLDFLSGNALIKEICDIRGGYAHNVIPSKAEAIVGLLDENGCRALMEKYAQKIQKTFDCPDIAVSLTPYDNAPLPIQGGLKMLEDIGFIQTGVYSMSKKINGLVETSMNLGIINIENESIKVVYLARSSVNADLFQLSDTTKEYFHAKGYETENDRGYLGWQDDPKSELLQVALQEGEKVLRRIPKVVAIHAGLECGAMVSGLGSGVNAISIGPNISEVHSVDERAEIASIERFERILQGILAKL